MIKRTLILLSVFLLTLTAMILFSSGAVPGWNFGSPAAVATMNLAAAAPTGGTDWTANEFLAGLYYFDSGGIQSDSSGQGNDIDENVGADPPSASAGDKIQGDQSADFESDGNDDACVIYMTNASALFPFKDANTAEITFAGWIQLESATSSRYVWSENASENHLRVLSTATNLSFQLKGAGGTEIFTITNELDLGIWYFIASVYSDAADEMYLYYRSNGAPASVWLTNTSATSGTLNIGTNNFLLPGNLDTTSATGIDGKMDAWALFNGKVFTQAELDGVYTNGWDGDGW